MSTGPQFIAIKRKRGEEAPAALLVERAGKRRITEPGFHYVLKESGEASAAVETTEKERDASTTPSLFDANTVQKRVEGSSGHQRGKLSRNVSGNGISQSNLAKERRTFHLKRVGTPEPKIGKRKGKAGKDRGIATFSEKRARRDMSRSDSKAVAAYAGRQRSSSVLSTQGGSPEPAERRLKRPGRSAAVRTNGTIITPPTGPGGKTDSQMQSMADSLHHFAVHEASKEGATTANGRASVKPKVTAMPKLSAQRSRAIHQQRVAQSSASLSRSPQNDDTSVDEEGDYVYDTYVLATSSGAAQIDAQDVGNVGYLIITEEDQAAWETYIDDDVSEEEPSDEDDENAEDWYGADYPDDEVASDDEFDRNAYGYRAGGSDDEEYDEHSFSEDEYERQMNPWLKKTPQQFAKYFDHGAEHEVEED